LVAEGVRSEEVFESGVRFIGGRDETDVARYEREVVGVDIVVGVEGL
jgi:hypothetical protein